MSKLSDYPGADLPKKAILRRHVAAYQLAARLLMDPLEDPADIRDEMVIVLLDYLSDPSRATAKRLTLAARGFAR